MSVKRTRDEITPAMDIKTKGLRIRVWALEEGESIQDPTSSKDYRRLYGPGIIVDQITPSGLTSMEYYVHGEAGEGNEGFWQWMQRLLTDPGIQFTAVESEETVK